MDWKSCVDNDLIGSGKVPQAAICDFNSGITLAASNGFSVSLDESKQIIKGFDDCSAICGDSGFTINGKKYTAVSYSDLYIYGEEDRAGCYVVRTAKTILVATYDEPTQRDDCSAVIEDLGEFFFSQGY